MAGSLFGHKKVYFVLGVNKIMPTLEEAIYRARNVAAPKNVLRHGYKCGCSLQGGDRCYDCGAPDRICNVLAIYYKKMRNIEGYRTKRVGKNLYYACIKGRIRGILKYARVAL
ncbi:LUD domain-containing protein [Dialister hominis]|uniref:LUD domain-containing protein n=1 Tax=Dialister hominis TaxID=2582419 RepID=UPI003A938EF8